MKKEDWSPKIFDLEVKEDICNVKLSFDEKLEVFTGHFPDFKITPGVVLTHCAIELAKKHLDIKDFKFKSFPRVKFMKPICPGKEVDLYLKIDRNKKSLQFKYSQSEHIYSQGKVEMEI